MMPRLSATASVLSGLLLLTGACTPGARNERPAAPAPLAQDLSQGDVTLLLEVAPGDVVYDRELLMTLTVQAPDKVEVLLPPLTDRLQGFILNGTFEQPSVPGTATERRIRARLTPEPGREQRLAPLPVTVIDRRTVPAQTNWFATRPYVFPVVDPSDTPPGDALMTTPTPVWVYPPFRTVVLYVLVAIMGAALLVLLAKLIRRAHRQVKLMRMSPRERALKELAVLLAKDLVARDRVKDFYLELTMIVRRYIERAHTVRAPEQTTEEFLMAVADSDRFSPDVIRTLRSFLQAADLVKFAAHRPPPDDIRDATTTARDYIETDAAATTLHDEASRPDIREATDHV